MIACPLTIAGLMHVVRSIRARDAEEVLCLCPGQTLAEWAAAAVRAPGNHFLFAADRGEPIAAGGWSEFGVKHVVRSWLIATEKISGIGDGLHRFAVRGHRCLIADGVRRFETLCLHAPGESTQRRWMKRLGYRLEGIHRRMGAAGQDLITMARVEA